MFFPERAFIPATITTGILFLSAAVLSAKPFVPTVETENFILYFGSEQDNAYRDCGKIAQTAEDIYKEVSSRLNMSRIEKISVFFVGGLYEDRAHGHAKVSMTKDGNIGIYIWYFPLTDWSVDGEFGFIKPLIPDVEEYFKKCLEEEVVKALFMRKYLAPQKEPRKFNTYLYEFAATLTSFYSHFGISWLLNSPSIDETLPVSDIFANKSADVRALDKAISFCGFLVEN
ncbi:MAG: hypothetical protein QME32_08510, partial [Endomicrobiia bacterium]|nr:hypothetical protein [Endomicrobiia bacterium]